MRIIASGMATAKKTASALILLNKPPVRNSAFETNFRTLNPLSKILIIILNAIIKAEKISAYITVFISLSLFIKE
jgi:hypothetical protein